jgi:hypothetical protein
MRRAAVAILLLFLSSTAVATTVVTSLTPDSGSIIGGSTQTVSMTVTIARDANDNSAYSGFTSCTHVDCGNPSIPAGLSSTTFQVSAQIQDGTVTGTVSVAIGGVVKQSTITVNPLVATISAPTQLSANQKATATVTLNASVASQQTMFITGSQYLSALDAAQFPAGSSSSSFTLQSGQPSVSTNATVSGGFSQVIDTETVNVLAVKNGRKRCKWCEQHAGHPVNIGNGNTWVESTDYSIPGLAGGMQLTRTWNSLWIDSLPVETVGTLGYAWRTNYDERLQAATGGGMNYWTKEGDEWTFTYDSLKQRVHLGIAARRARHARL